MDFPGMEGGEGEEASGGGLKARTRPAERDPAHYEFSDYL